MPDRKTAYKRGYAEGAEAAVSDRYYSSQEMRLAVVDYKEPISDLARTWNLGFARGYRESYKP